MATQSIELIPLEKLLIDLSNPRHPHQASQRDAIHTIAHDQGPKLFNLAEDIVDEGLNPSDLVIVTPAEQEDAYTVLEGNRRVAALKLLGSAKLLDSMDLPSNLKERFKALQKRAEQNVPMAINCAVVSREEAVHWIHLKHTGENAGVGIVAWDGVQTQRFRGESPSLQAIQMVEKSEYIDDETRKKLPKISITNIERVLNTPEARKALGFDVQDGRLTISAPNEEDALARLAMLVSDVAKKEVTVSDLRLKDDRVKYAQNLAARPLPTQQGSTNANSTNSGNTNVNGASPTTPRPPVTRRVSPYRKALIPRDLKLTIRHTRINQIYHELQALDVEEFRNCCAVMLRVFVEMSVDDYAEREHISLKVQGRPGTTPPPDKDLKLQVKIRTVVDYLERNGKCDKSQLHGIRTLISQEKHVLSVDSLHAYVHNKDFNPPASDLKANWDSIQAFVVALWSM